MNERISRVIGLTLGGAGLVMAAALFWARVASADAPTTAYERWTAVQAIIMMFAAKIVYPPHRGGR